MPITRRLRISLAGALAGALVGALAGLLAAPGSAAIAVPVNCSDDVTLSGDGQTYQLYGTCGVVTVTASNATVHMPTAQKLVVRGDHNSVDAKPVPKVRVRGHDQQVTVESVQWGVVDSPGSVVHVDGLLEHLRVPGHGARVRARQISTLHVGGDRNHVRARKGYDATVGGDRNTLTYRWLEQLRVPGDHNTVTVRRGTTETQVRGTGSHLHLHHRA